MTGLLAALLTGIIIGGVAVLFTPTSTTEANHI